MKNILKPRLIILLPVILSLLLSAPLYSFAAEDGSSAPAVYSITVVNGYAVDAAGNTITEAAPGTQFLVRFDETSLPDEYHALKSWTANVPEVDADISTRGNTGFIQIIMPGSPLTITAIIGDNEEALASSSAAASVEESRSIAESVSISESESIRESESIQRSEEESSRIAELEERSREASIAQSEKEAARIEVDGYRIYKYLNNVQTPAGFTRANDVRTFEETIECFYSSAYRLYVYYADKDDTEGYVVYDKLHESMFPFVSFSGSDGEKYIVSSPDRQSDLPKEVLGDTRVNLSIPGSGSSAVVPGWNVEDASHDLYPLIYLIGDDGSRSFFAYQDDNGSISLTPWADFKESLTESETESESTVESTEETSESQTISVTPETASTEPERQESLLGNYVIWIVIAVLIVALLVAAIIIVVQMSRKQDEEEREIDFEEIPEDDELLVQDEYMDQDRFDTAYTQEDNDLRPFDISFEDAFPDEIGYKKPSADLQEDSVDSFERPKDPSAGFRGEIDEWTEPVQGEVVDPVPEGTLPEDFSEDDYEEVRVRVRHTEIKDTEVYVRRKAGPKNRRENSNPENAKKEMPAIYDEVLQEDFEVVDFNDKKNR